MNDLIIRAKTLKREGVILIILFVVSFLVNLYAVIAFDGSYLELFTQIGWVLVITLVLYLVIALIRTAVYFGTMIFMYFKK